MAKNASPLTPPVTVLVKLGSIAVHTEEMMSAKGHRYDALALVSLLEDQEVLDWLAQMDAMAMIPKKR